MTGPIATEADAYGTIAFPNNFDRYLEPGKKATTASSALVVGRVVTLAQSTGLWARATSGDVGRAGVVPKIYQGKDVNSDSNANCVIFTGIGGEIYVEAADAIKPGAKVTFGNGGTVKNWSSGTYIGVYKGHYGEGGAGEPPTDAAASDSIRIALERGAS